VEGLIHKCDFARFAPSAVKPGDVNEALKEAEKVITGIEGVKLG
jgi:hypothetical protein